MRIALAVSLAVGVAPLVSAASAQTALASLVSQGPNAPGGLSAKEIAADKVWTLRAGLNVAALQCQFSRFLATVPTYNALLQHHSGEFSDSFKTLSTYFVRQAGARSGPRAFDTYATRTSQSWATFDAQLSFCNAAAAVGRRALMVPKGKLAEFASAELELFRNSLVFVPPPTPGIFLVRHIDQFVMPDFNKCDKKGRCRWDDKSWFTGLRSVGGMQQQAGAMPADSAARPKG